MRYRTKPAEVEAAKFGGQSIPEFAMGSSALGENGTTLLVKTHEGERVCNVGDYLVLSDNGQLLVRERALFETYFALAPDN